MKYRSLLVNNESLGKDLYWSTIVIQVKKWYGWVTFCTINDVDTRAHSRATFILNTLKEE